MLKVYKYEIEIKDIFEIEMPSRAKILKVETQYNKPCMWVLVNPDHELVVRKFRFAGTGHSIEGSNINEYNHISTFQMQDGALIFHIFEIV
jgi:hypothetical protein